MVDRIDGFELVAEVASGEDAVAASTTHAPDLVLMDINMGELDGIAATRLITAAAPATKVILVSTYELEDLPPGANASGAVAYVNKDELSHESCAVSGKRQLESSADTAMAGAPARCASRSGTPPASSQLGVGACRDRRPLSRLRSHREDRRRRRRGGRPC